MRWICSLSLLTLAATACNKAAPPADPAAAPAPAKVEAAAPAPAPAAAPAPAPAAAPSAPPEAPKTASLSALNDPCPGPDEDAATCPKTPATIDDNIKVAHVLIGWAGSLPGEKTNRDKAAALKLATEIAHKARKSGSDFISMMWDNSQDPGPGVYEVTPPLRARYVPEFSKMATSLGVGQVDIVETRFGFHVMKRLPFDFQVPTKPIVPVMNDACPGPGEDAAACPRKQDPAPTSTEVSHILITYSGSAPGVNEKRNRAEAKELAIKLCHEARKKHTDFAKLMKENSQDPGPGTYPVTADAGLVPQFKQLGLALGVGQVDVVETNFGFHVMKRLK